MFNPQRRPETWENKNQKSRREQRKDSAIANTRDDQTRCAHSTRNGKTD